MQNFQAKLKGLWEKVKGFFKKLNKKMRILLGVCLVVLLAVIIAAAVLLNRKEYVTLFTGLTASESSTVINFLNNNGLTDYQIQNDSILVPKGREDQLRAALILSGDLNNAFLYNYYTDHVSLTSTSAEQEMAARISLQERLEATIELFDGVQNAVVTISPGERQIYVIQDSATPATASVTVTTDGRQLSDNVVRAIRYTVSHSVQELDIEDVTVNDQYGNPYSDNSTAAMSGQATALKLEYEERISNNVRMQILNTLQRIYGEENVSASVLCTVEVTHKLIDSKEYNQPAGSVEGGGLILDDHLFYERIQGDGAPVGGTVGTTTNSDLNGNFPNYPDLNQDLGDGDAYLGEQIDRNHGVNETNTQEEVLEGRLKDLRIVVSVNQNAPNSGAMTIDALRDQVATLAGIAGTESALNRVHVSIVPFNDTTADVTPGGVWFLSPENSWILYAAIGGLVLFIVLLILILVLARRRKKKRLAQQQALEEEMLEAQAAAEAAAILAAAPPTGGADIMEVNTEKSMELRQEVRKFAQNNPEIAAQMVKAWLKGDENGG